MVRPEGFEPSTFWSEARRSIQLSYERTNYVLNYKMNKTITFLAKETNKDNRLDKFITNKLTKFTRSQIKKIILSRNVKINHKTVSSPSQKIKLNDSIEISIFEKKNDYIKPKKIDIDITYQDKDLIIINKPSGLTVHPGAGNKENTLVNGLLYLYKKELSNLSGSSRPGIVHRIDKETSGLLVVAKNNFAHSDLSKQFSNHSISRSYFALVWGVVRPLNGKITTLISRSKKNRQLMSVSEISGKKATTNYKTIKVYNFNKIPKISLIECILETGRTHQIRVHYSHKGNPLLGDKKYGKKKLQFRRINKKFEDILYSLNRQALHAKSLGFIHPTKKRFVNFESKLPQDFKKILDFLEKFTD